ncbi:MAG: hypothetical protein H7Z37_02655 [Pyrinomonadaceae bacterium]|nr:hypothetical protein [Pyrinomonadaceae bacterium]
MKTCLIKILTVIFLTLFVSTVNAQTETLTNAEIITLSNAKIGKAVLLLKIKTSNTNFDVTAKEIIKLKTADVDDDVILAMLAASNDSEKLATKNVESTNVGKTKISEVAPKPQRAVEYKTPSELLRDAKTIFFKKTSNYPSLQDLESSLLKNSRSQRWQRFNLTITRYEADADLILQISNEFLTHYNFRVVDVKTGRVITASGVTSLGGALSGNVADKLLKRFEEVIKNK